MERELSLMYSWHRKFVHRDDNGVYDEIRWTENHTHSILYSFDRASRNPSTHLLVHNAGESTIWWCWWPHKKHCLQHPLTNSHASQFIVTCPLPLLRDHVYSWEFLQKKKYDQEPNRNKQSQRSDATYLQFTTLTIRVWYWIFYPRKQSVILSRQFEVVVLHSSLGNNIDVQEDPTGTLIKPCSSLENPTASTVQPIQFEFPKSI